MKGNKIDCICEKPKGKHKKLGAMGWNRKMKVDSLSG